jgi:hypothetical protein
LYPRHRKFPATTTAFSPAMWRYVHDVHVHGEQTSSSLLRLSPTPLFLREHFIYALTYCSSPYTFRSDWLRGWTYTVLSMVKDVSSHWFKELAINFHSA